MGITLSKVQINLAKKYAEKRKISDKVNFYQKDYFKTGFDENTFDKIYGIESFCHAYPESEKCFGKMYRILKPGGAIFISDGLLARNPENKVEEKLIKDYCWGFKLYGLHSREEIISALKKAGFKKIMFIDNSELIKKSVHKFSKIYKMMLIPSKIMKALHLFSDIEHAQMLSAKNEEIMYNKDLFGYGIFYAEK